MGFRDLGEFGAHWRRNLPTAFVAPLALAVIFAPQSTESAIANGDTRTLVLSNQHTNESGAFTYMVNGSYDSAVLEKLNWFLRDWRLNEPTKMDPKLFDILWEVYLQSGSKEPIDVLSGYRSPQTNAMLRRRSRQVAEHSQHMEGKAIDAHFTDVTTATIRDVAMRMQAGGVGFYPTGITPWVHVDSGSVRYWPRMSRDALARIFPDGKTVFIPVDGQPMPGYDLARAEIESRGGAVPTTTASSGSNFGFLSFLFGGPRGGGVDDAEESGSEAETVNASHAGRGGQNPVVSAAPDPLASARANLPKGETYMQPAPATQPAPSDESAPNVVASATSDAAPVALHGPIADKFIAPLPPRKPSEIVALAFADAPLPPMRPIDLMAPASTPSAPAPVAPLTNRDLIAALIERGRLPGVITRGMGPAPSSALALVGPEAAGEAPEKRAALLDRAAALAAPLPPVRPSDLPSNDVSRAVRNAPSPAATPAARHPGGQGSLSPYGALVADAFIAPSASATENQLAQELRGATQ